MKTINMEAINKLMKAKQLEKEALIMLLPERVQGHLNVISKEITEMVLETLVDINGHYDNHQNVNEEEKEVKAEKKVKKVDIG